MGFGGGGRVLELENPEGRGGSSSLENLDGKEGGKCLPSGGRARGGGALAFFWNNPLPQYVWVCRQLFSHMTRQI